jgi:hypothetical protein
MPDLTGVLTLVHILFATLWVGGAVLLVLYGMSVMKADVATRIGFSKMTLVTGRFFAVFAVIALIAGTWLVLRVDYFGFDQAWISIGFTAIIIGAVLGPAFFTPQAKALIGELESGSANAEARGRRIGMVAMLESLMLIAVIWAMVYKPGL